MNNVVLPVNSVHRTRQLLIANLKLCSSSFSFFSSSPPLHSSFLLLQLLIYTPCFILITLLPLLKCSPPLFRPDGHSGGANAPGRFPLLPLDPRPLPPRHQRQRLHQAGRDPLPETQEPGLAEVAIPETEFPSRGRRQLLPGRHAKALPAQGE